MSDDHRVGMTAIIVAGSVLVLASLIGTSYYRNRNAGSFNLSNEALRQLAGKDFTITIRGVR